MAIEVFPGLAQRVSCSAMAYVEALLQTILFRLRLSSSSWRPSLGSWSWLASESAAKSWRMSRSGKKKTLCHLGLHFARKNADMGLAFSLFRWTQTTALSRPPTCIGWPSSAESVRWSWGCCMLHSGNPSAWSLELSYPIRIQNN